MCVCGDGDGSQWREKRQEPEVTPCMNGNMHPENLFGSPTFVTAQRRAYSKQVPGMGDPTIALLCIKQRLGTPVFRSNSCLQTLSKKSMFGPSIHGAGTPAFQGLGVSKF